MNGVRDTTMHVWNQHRVIRLAVGYDPYNSAGNVRLLHGGWGLTWRSP